MRGAGDPYTRRLITILVLGLGAIDVVAVLARAVLDPTLGAGDLPLVSAVLVHFAVVLWLNETRFHRVAAFLFCLAPVWLNVIEGLHRPDGPVWYALFPMAAILGAAFLRFRPALLLGALGVVGALVVVIARADVVTGDRASLIVMYVGLMNTAALGMAVFRDRVERARRAEVERLAGQLAATERLESIGRLAGGIAHDFNNLLTVILSSVEVARWGELDALDDLESAARRAAALTRQLLAFSRHRGGERTVVAVDEAIEAVHPLLRRLVPENIEIELRLGAPGATQLEDQQLEQILFNLTANARDAMRKGGKLTISTRVETVTVAAPPRHAGEFIVIEVGDSGTGMDAATRAHVFEPFFTTKPVGEGTGLGLSTVHGIVRRAGGWLELDTAPGEGTRIRIALSTASPAPPPETRPVEGPRPLSGSVLLVEDDALVRRAISRVLTGLGLTVLVAGAADEVAGVLASAPGPLALLVTDVVMPGRSGVELAESMRVSNPALPVLFVSGYTDEDLRGMLSQPATRFVAKPFEQVVLAEAVRELLGGAKASSAPEG